MTAYAFFGKMKKFLSGIAAAYRKKGGVFVLRSAIKTIVWYPYYKKSRASKTFLFRGDAYPYFIHYYNLTWENERTVEVPIIWKIVGEHAGEKILEAGNVLSNYFSVHHDIVDKYEVADGVINQDVCDFQPSQKYDLIVSISTLQHVGWDETPREPMKIPQAIRHLETLLVPRGTLVVTLPLGYNHDLDEMLRKRKIPFTKMYCLKRTSANNEWSEVDWQSIAHAGYDRPFRGANGLVVGVVEKK